MRHLVLLVCTAAVALPGPACGEGWEALKRPGTVAIMRHAIAPGTGDPENFRLGDCSTQRNLDERGRAQARAVGAAIRAAEVEVDRVLSSQWCRSRETAELLKLAPVEEMPALNSFFRDRSAGEAQTRVLGDYLTGLPEGETVMLVTHQVNITALTGRGVASGEVFVLEVGPEGRVEVVEEVLVQP